MHPPCQLVSHLRRSVGGTSCFNIETVGAVLGLAAVLDSKGEGTAAGEAIKFKLGEEGLLKT